MALGLHRGYPLSWLRIDDGFARHSKFAGWPAARKWAWLELLCDCAQRETSGFVTDDLALLPRAVTKSLLTHAEKAGLLDRLDDDRLRVHDWLIYNGTVEEKVSTYLADNPEASANDVHRAVGGRRDAILEAVRAYREAGSLDGTNNGTTSSTTEPSEVVPNPVPKAVHARATPSPAPALTPEDQDPPSFHVPLDAEAGRTDQEIEALAELVAQLAPEDIPW